MNRLIKKKTPRAPPGTHPPRRRRAQTTLPPNKQQQPTAFGLDLELGSLKSEITVDCNRLETKHSTLTMASASTPGREKNKEGVQSDGSSYSGDRTTRGLIVSNVATEISCSSAAGTSEPFRKLDLTYQHSDASSKAEYCRSEADWFSKATLSTCPLPGHSDVFLLDDSPDWWSHMGGGDISPIGEILQEYSYLFEQDTDEEEDIDIYLSPLLRSATTAMNNYDILLSSELLPSSHSGLDDAIAIDGKETADFNESSSPLPAPTAMTASNAKDTFQSSNAIHGTTCSATSRKEIEHESKSFFAGKSFFLVGGGVGQ